MISTSLSGDSLDALLTPVLKNLHYRLLLAISLIFAAETGSLCAPCPAPEGLWISSLEFEGLKQTRSNVVKDALENRKGETFSCAAWEREQNRLKDLGIFAKVDLKAQTTNDSLSLVYTFRELPPYLPLASVNKTDQDGFSIGPSISALNFLGTGKRIDLMARFGGTTEYQAAISGRQLFGKPVEFSAAWIHVDSYNPFDSSHENSHRVKSEGFWPLIKSNHFGATGFAEYFVIEEGRDSITLRKGGDFVPRLGLGLRWDSRDRALLPRRGVFAEARLTQNGGGLGGPADFWEEMSDIRVYLPLTRRNGIIADALYQYRYGTKLGYYDWFRVGGANTLRGYPDNAYFGRNECLFNLEYRFDAMEEKVQSLGPWSLNYGVQLIAGFDAASLWNSESMQPEKFHPGIYAGLHLLVPGVNRIRLEIGSHDINGRVYWNLGLFEKTTTQRFRTR